MKVFVMRRAVFATKYTRKISNSKEVLLSNLHIDDHRKQATNNTSCSPE
jgi:hypothetical protein